MYSGCFISVTQSFHLLKMILFAYFGFIIIQVALSLEKAGVDLLEISGGNYDSIPFKEFDVDADQAELDEIISKYSLKRSTATREAYYLKYSRDVINALQSVTKDKKRRMCIMCTGGFRSKKVMLEALNSKGCDIIGIGRPLCGKPDGSMELLKSKDDEEYELPRYEGTLIVGHPWIHHGFLNNKRVWKVLSFLPLFVFIARQYWYYMQIISIGRTGKVDLKMGCFAALRANSLHERKCARNLVGIKSVGRYYNSGGSVDNPPMVVVEKKGNGISMIVKVLCVLVVGLSVLYYYKYYVQKK